ncbi:MAG: SDR family oxidoreductase [Geminicoccaceae bacterium]|nr:SDR family oxidoreductase [Geminicoccaceae bacterium]MCS7267987.1 SDR family oxidoreductase [Geminicoccaceae bacterium]MCX7629868.1 SDR family oxidoreductase [Geminicoccaceae bacterium]MDW8124099.1 SDR family NAD(P)-dependent oxidoreductase [Geminicoccaceae bacterium]MDW8340238.1 SDR family NAD(P)-dependent oxidoreductase [Geminicoccaceae bacterium]
MGYDGALFVVTGAAGGIGRETVKLLLAKDARLLLIDRDEGRLRALESELAAGKRITAVVSDLATPAACEQALDAVDGPVYAFVHLAGLFEPEDFASDARAVWDRVQAANLTNAFDMAVAVSRRFDEERVCRIVLVSSLAFRRGSFDHVSYSAAKGGIVGLVRALSRRLAPHVLVNGIAPGHIETGMPAHIWADRTRSERMLAEIPLRRRGHPREVATVIDFLCGDGATYITGQVINVDGGVVNS